MYTHNEWTNFGDISPWHGQLWVKNAHVDNTDDFAECIEIIGPGYLGLSDNQLMIVHGSIYMPIDDPERVKSALDCTGDTPSMANWITLMLAFHAYYGIEPDAYFPQEIVQIGKSEGGLTADVILHGNAKIENYLKREVLV